MKDFYIIFSFFILKLFLPLYIPIFYNDVLPKTVTSAFFYILCDIFFILGIYMMYYTIRKKNVSIKPPTHITKADITIDTYFYGLPSLSNQKMLYIFINIMLGILVSILLLGLAFLNKIPYVYQQNPDILFPSTNKMLYKLPWLFVIIFAAFSEELFYRSYLLRRFAFLRMPTIVVILCASFLFAISHTVNTSAQLETHIKIFLFSFSSGILLSVLMIFRKSLLTNYVAHVLYNIGVYFIL